MHMGYAKSIPARSIAASVISPSSTKAPAGPSQHPVVSQGNTPVPSSTSKPPVTSPSSRPTIPPISITPSLTVSLSPISSIESNPPNPPTTLPRPPGSSVVTTTSPIIIVQQSNPTETESTPGLSIPPQAMDAANGLPQETDDLISAPTPSDSTGTAPFKAHGTHTQSTSVIVDLDDGTTVLSVTKTLAASSNVTPKNGESRSPTSGGFSAWIIAAIIGGVACLIAITIGGIMYRKWRRKRHRQSGFQELSDAPGEIVQSVQVQLSGSEQSSPRPSPHPNEKGPLPTLWENPLEEEEGYLLYEEDMGVTHLMTMEEWSSRTHHHRSLSADSQETEAPPSYRSQETR